MNLILNTIPAPKKTILRKHLVNIGNNFITFNNKGGKKLKCWKYIYQFFKLKIICIYA